MYSLYKWFSNCTPISSSDVVMASKALSKKDLPGYIVSYLRKSSSSSSSSYLCLGTQGGKSDNGTAIIIWDCNSNPDQSWTYTSTGQLKGVGGKCISARGGSVDNGTPIILWECNGLGDQSWH
ncbi:MAG: ricin-type beta-trefoil lectin domain protein [Rhizonema sp. PD37]|nr:ricin-type beta-trefoil lectin domain protein [Rhizonema sp. PD37]